MGWLYGQKKLYDPIEIEISTEKGSDKAYEYIREHYYVKGEIEYSALLGAYRIEASTNGTTIIIKIPESVFEQMKRLKEG